MKHIQTITVGAGGAANIEFTSIPQTYTDLIVVCSFRENASATQRSGVMQFNGDTGNNYTNRLLQGDGSTASSSSNTTSYITWYIHTDTNSTANTFSNCAIYIPNYAGSTNKSVSVDAVGENNATFSLQRFNAGLWSNTSAITSIKLSGESSNLVQYSSASLYGIKNS